MERRPTDAHVLVMNDTWEVVDLLTQLLEEEGYRVSSSLLALDLEEIRTLRPDAMVLDVLFAGDRIGWKLLELLRLDRELCRIPIVLCTAAVEVVRDEAMAAQLAAQAVEVVLKPFDLDQLLAALTRALAAGTAGPGDGDR